MTLNGHIVEGALQRFCKCTVISKWAGHLTSADNVGQFKTAEPAAKTAAPASKHSVSTPQDSQSNSPHLLLTVAVFADMAIAYIFWEEFGIMATDPGYGYFRPSINLFDPGWRLTPDGHDTGTHAAAVMDRQASTPSNIFVFSDSRFLFALPTAACCSFLIMPHMSLS